MKTTKRGKRIAVTAGSILFALAVVIGVSYRSELVAWYAFHRTFEGLGNNEQGRPEYKHRQTGIVFVGLSRATFEMGSPDDEVDRTRFPKTRFEGPVHKVTLSPFLVAKYAVSQAEWKRVMGKNPSKFKGDALPVEGVSWEDCQEFCTKSGLSLPTEAQWEHACRAGKAGPFAGTGKIDDMGWHFQNSGGTTHPVGEKQANDFGLYDMHGNVMEWCEDWYRKDFYQESAGARDPSSENSRSGYRVARGGSWHGADRYCRSAFRRYFQPTFRDLSLGFRVVWRSR